MKIEKGQLIAGYPSLKIRAILKECQRMESGISFEYLSEIVAKHLEIHSLETNAVITTLIEEGFIHKNEHGWHENTIQGNSLAMSKLRRIPRKKAIAEVEGLLRRAAEVNKGKYYPHVVQKIEVFGSYLTASEDLGDVDVIVTLTMRYPAGHQQSEFLEEFWKKELKKKGVPNYFLQSWYHILWPEECVNRFLKGRARIFEFHQPQDAQAAQGNIKVIFERENDSTF